MWEGETVVRRCDSSQGGVKVVSVDGVGEHQLGEV